MKRTRGELRQIVGGYIRTRLREECRVRGTAATIERATGFSSAHITNVQKEGRGVGEDFARAMAQYWGIGYAELERLAHEWAAANFRPAQSRRSPVSLPLRDYPEWPAELEKAQRHYRSLSIEDLDRVGDAVMPGRRPTWELIGRVAHILIDTEEVDAQALPPSSGALATTPPSGRITNNGDPPREQPAKRRNG